ncbi:MAG: hypothetical protein AAF215_27890 [Cyanobacteria bacterium P01_A01_bin.123]
MIDPDANAFPIFEASGRYNPLEAGLTKREYFAAMAMQGILGSDVEGTCSYEAFAKSSVKQADALIAALNSPEHEPVADSTLNLQDIIATTCLSIGGDYNVRVRLSTLRQNLSSLPRTELDQALKDMQISGRLVLMTLDNPQEITADDEAAAIDMGSPNKRHILYLNR